MQKFIRASSLIIILLSGKLLGVTIVAETGHTETGERTVYFNRVFAASWTQSGAYSDVDVVASLPLFRDIAVTATAWLTTEIGPAATAATQVAMASVALHTAKTVMSSKPADTLVFSNLELGSGTYYLVISVQDLTESGWWGTDIGSFPVTDTGVTLGTSFMGTYQSYPVYGPAADLIPAEREISWIYSVTGTPAVVPEPAAWLLLGAGVVVVFGWRPRPVRKQAWIS